MSGIDGQCEECRAVYPEAHKPGCPWLDPGWDPEPELLHEWHDHPPLGYHDEAVPGCLSCERRWELTP